MAKQESRRGGTRITVGDLKKMLYPRAISRSQDELLRLTQTMMLQKQLRILGEMIEREQATAERRADNARKRRELLAECETSIGRASQAKLNATLKRFGALMSELEEIDQKHYVPIDTLRANGFGT